MKYNLIKIVICIMVISLISCNENVIDINNNISISLPEEAESIKANPEEGEEMETTEQIKDEVITSLTEEDIMWIQESLKIAGFYTSMDGSLGSNTKEKLQKFKSSVGLNNDDVYTTETKKRFEQIREEKIAPGVGTYMVLLNKNYYIPSDYIPDNLTEVNVRKHKYIELVKEVSDKTEAMFRDAESDGLNIYLASGYRSYLYQESIFSRRVANNGFDEAQTVVAIPGQSEHQTGLTIDITSEAMGFGLHQNFDQQAEFRWMMENAYKYGFILRYRDGKEEDTGYIYEPWHYRYIGDVEKAKYIMENELILEEYFEEN